jgi:hypothetical protein
VEWHHPPKWQHRRNSRRFLRRDICRNHRRTLDLQQRIVNLRQPQSKYSYFLDAEITNDADGDVSPGYQYPNWQPINMINDSGTELSVPATFPTSGTPAWKNTWKACS